MTSFRAPLWLGQLSPGRWVVSFWVTTSYPTRGRELEGALRLHEFTREAEELHSWLAGQTQVARGGEGLREDHEGVLVRRGLDREEPEAER